MFVDSPSTSAISKAADASHKLCLVQHSSQHPIIPLSNNKTVPPEASDIMNTIIGDTSKNVQDGQEIPSIPTPTSSKRQFKKAEKSQVEKLMELQISASTNLVAATENLVSEVKVSNKLKERQNELLYSLVCYKAEELSYKRKKYNTGEQVKHNTSHLKKS